MPVNNNLKPVNFPMPIRFGEKPTTEFKNNVEAINVTIEKAPTMQDLRDYLVNFATATWEDNPIHNNDLSEYEKDKIIYMIFKGKMLPSALETIKINFLFEGISGQDVTHILRYRTATFSAECSADKWWTNKAAVVPTSIENSPGNYLGNYEEWFEGIAKDDFGGRYEWLIRESKKLYCEMLDSKEISLLDARFILPRAMETYYWMSMDLGSAINFVRHRIDKQIQPETDNVMAYKMWSALLDYYPLLVDLIDIHAPAAFYVNTARTGRCTNLFKPDKDSDIYEYNEKDYVYGRERREVNGTDPVLSTLRSPFDLVLADIDDQVALTKHRNLRIYGEEFFII